MKCVNCGAELREGAKFCDSCGEKTEIAKEELLSAEHNLYEAYISEFKAAKKQIRKRKFKKFIIAEVIAIVAALVFFLFYKGIVTCEQSDIVIILSALVAAGFLSTGVRCLIYTSRSDNKILEQINQAYEIAKFRK